MRDRAFEGVSLIRKVRRRCFLYQYCRFSFKQP
jgi:hypothetical protein